MGGEPDIDAVQSLKIVINHQGAQLKTRTCSHTHGDVIVCFDDDITTKEALRMDEPREIQAL